jgi:hypothetical protein
MKMASLPLPRPELPAVRPLLVTGAVCLVAAGAHILGGGTLPSGEASMALAALVMAAVTLVPGRRFSLGTITALLGIGQVLLHEALSLHTRGAACGNVLTSGKHHPPQAATCLTPGEGLFLHSDPALAMVLAHLLGAAVTAVLLGRAEAVLWQLAAWFQPLAQALQPVDIGRAGMPLVGAGSCSIPSPWRHRGNDNRGPPAHRVPLAMPSLNAPAAEGTLPAIPHISPAPSLSVVGGTKQRTLP